jgi:non-specific serine/threonine protein kinase
LGDTAYQLRVIYGLWLVAMRAADIRASLARAREYEVLAETFHDSVAGGRPPMAHLVGISRFHLGDNASAAVALEQANALYATAAGSGDEIRLGVDMMPITLCYQAITYWLLGFPEKSLRIGQEAIKKARIVNSLWLSATLGLVSSIILVRIGALEMAKRCIDEAIDHAARHSLVPFHALGLCAKGSLLAARGDAVTANQLLDRGLARMREVVVSLYTPIYLSERASVLGSLGQRYRRPLQNRYRC